MHRELFRVLAYAQSGVLPVRREWIGDPLRRTQLSSADLKAMLQALQSHVEGDHADQAATAALALLIHADQDISDLARDPEVAVLKVLRARDVRARRPVALSLKALIELSQAGLLFAASVDANRLLPLLAEALPHATLLIVEGNAAQFLRESGGSTFLLHTAGKDSAFALINKASSFGTDDSRLRLLEQLGPDVGDDPTALRRLCAGVREAGYSSTKLWVLDRVHNGVERIATRIVNQSQNEFLVATRIAEELKPKLRNHLRIAVLDTANLEALLSDNIAAIARLAPTAAERDAFLTTELTDPLLVRLPIHARMDETIGDAAGVFRVTDEWPVPASLEGRVPIVQLCSSQKALERQKRLIMA